MYTYIFFKFSVPFVIPPAELKFSITNTRKDLNTSEPTPSSATFRQEYGLKNGNLEYFECQPTTFLKCWYLCSEDKRTSRGSTCF